MTPERLKQLRAMCEKATAEPWEIIEETEDEYASDKKWRRINSITDTSVEASICEVGDWNHDGAADAVFIAESRTAIPELLDEVEHLKRQVVEADSWMDDAKNADRQIIESLRAALAAMTAARDEACDLADEGWNYAPDYFREKWNADARTVELREVGAK